MKRRAIKESDPYDWEKNDSQHSSSGTLSNNPHMREPLHGNITQLTVAASNASAMEYTKRKTECDTVPMTATEPPTNQKGEKVSPNRSKKVFQTTSLHLQLDKNCNATQTASQQASGFGHQPKQPFFPQQQIYNQHKQYLQNLNQNQTLNDQNQNIVTDGNEHVNQLPPNMHKIQKAPSEIIITRETANKNAEKALMENSKNPSSPIKRRSASQIEVLFVYSNTSCIY